VKIYTELKKIIQFLSAFLIAPAILGGCTSNAGAEKEVHGLVDLKGEKVAVLTGSIQDILIEQNFPEVERVSLNTVPDLMVAVQTHKADYCVEDSVLIVAAKMNERGLKYVSGTELGSMQAGFCFNKNNPELRDTFNVFLAQIKENGIFDEICDRWICDEAGDSRMPEIELPAEGEPIVIGEISAFPFCFIQNGEEAGMEVEVLRRFAQFMNRPIIIQDYEFAALLTSLGSGKIDIAGAFIFKTPEREKEVLFSDSYFESTSVIIGRDEDFQHNVGFFQGIKRSFNNNLIVENRWKLILEGLWATILITVLAVLLGTLLGILVCGLISSQNKTVNKITEAYCTIIEGVPQLVLLMILFYVVFGKSGIDPKAVAILAFALVFGVSSGKIFHNGISAVDKGQREAGLSLGFTKTQTFFRFIFPQALKRIVPLFAGEAVALLKETSIVGYVAIADLTKISDVIRSRTFDAFFPLIVISILYFVLAWILGKSLESLASKIK